MRLGWRKDEENLIAWADGGWYRFSKVVEEREQRQLSEHGGIGYARRAAPRVAALAISRRRSALPRSPACNPCALAWWPPAVDANSRLARYGKASSVQHQMSWQMDPSTSAAAAAALLIQWQAVKIVPLSRPRSAFASTWAQAPPGPVSSLGPAELTACIGTPSPVCSLTPEPVSSQSRARHPRSSSRPDFP
ncbi:hypothetical protein L1887_61703 [Cichorium endivia]|nr:hypothetical protein L1887_61703 [Cichorium endivia]